MGSQPDPLAPLKGLIAEQVGVVVEWDGCGAVTLSRAESPTRIVIDLFWHKTGFDATRYQGGTPEGALLHYWVSWIAPGTRRDSKRFRICHNLQQVADELAAWASPVPEVPAVVTVESAAPALRQPWLNMPPAPEPRVSSSVLDEAARAALDRDLGCLDWPRLVAHWPVAVDGSPMLKTRVLLAAYGPPTSRRQPCLMVCGADTKRDMKLALSGQPGGFTITVTDEFADNQSDSWAARRSWWTGIPEPAEPPLADQCRALLAEGEFSQACDRAGVELGDLLRHAAAGSTLTGSSVTHYVDFNPTWVPVLHAALARLGPWLLADGLARVEARLAASNKKPLKRSTWSRRLVDFPGQSQQRKLGLHAELTPDGQPCLDIDASASNARLPLSDWTDPRFLAGVTTAERLA